jgi:hypothetical protein
MLFRPEREPRSADTQRDILPPRQSGLSSHPERTRTGSSHVEPSTQSPEMQVLMRVAQAAAPRPVEALNYLLIDRRLPPRIPGTITHPSTWQPKGRTVYSVTSGEGFSP